MSDESQVLQGAALGVAPARLHLENVRRLEALRLGDEGTLVELGELAAALRTQLILARYSGEGPGDVRDIVGEVWARVEVLGSALEAPLGSDPHLGHDRDQAHLVG